MFVLLFLLFVWSDSCHSQIVYNRLMTYDPRYMARPVRRSAMDALERLRLPVTRYFPQVDTQAAPYQGPPLGYQLGDVYALPLWTDEEQPLEEEDYGNYEYEAINPIYRSPAYPIYGQDPNEMMGAIEEPKEEMFDLQRRSSNRMESDMEVSTTPSQPPSSTQQVQMTAVPAAPEKKDVKSRVVPDPVNERDNEEGQKEEPLFRPLQTSQRTTWNGLRVKNTQQKSPIPLLKKMIQSGQQMKRQDPLLEQLTSLKKKI